MNQSETDYDASADRRGSPLYERLARIEEQLKLSERLVTIETQVLRLIKDEEDDRGSLAKMLVVMEQKFKDTDLRLRALEFKVYIAIGLALAADYALRTFIK